MAPRSAADRLADIRDAVVDLLDIADGHDVVSFQALRHADRKGFRALKNALTEMGEAVKALPSDITGRHPGIDWKGFAGLRDMVTHQYFVIDMRRLLPIIQHEVPGLLAAIDTELNQQDTDTPPAPGNP